MGVWIVVFFFFKQKTAYEIVSGDWSSDVCSSDLPVRKVGKLPSDRIRASYDLEYGTDSLEMHSDAIERGQRVLIVDDLLATGGTAKATVDLVKQIGGVVEGVAFLIELVALNGRSKLPGETIHVVL